MFKDIERWADILAIPFWLLAVIYFLKIKNKNKTEQILTLFVIMGLLCDSYFSLSFLGMLQ
jgi:hypothetical protein